MPFTKLGLHSSLLPVLEQQGYTQPTPIQQQAIPAILSKKDVLGIAQTGSGKTVSYVLPVLMNMQGSKVKNRHIHTLVLVPTRELAVQVNEVFQQFCNVLPQRIQAMAVYGGVSINPQMMQLQGTEVLVATPGRLLELIENKAIHLSEIETLVLDEADKMLNLGFRDEMEQLFRLMPKVRQNLLFSATMHEGVEGIVKQLLHKPIVVSIENSFNTDTDLIVQRAYSVIPEKKGPLLRHLIQQENMQHVLVFTSSVYQADNVADKLRKNKIDAVSIHSKKSQGARTEALRDFKSGKLRVLVATDLLARGIDIQFLPFVINYELPRSPKDYIHRIGRTGRAENPGVAISLIAPDEEHHFTIIQQKMKKVVEVLDGEVELFAKK
ncbi:MAG: DEAD/DEAH box helicase [Bacteroidota bacterium]